VSIIIPTKEEPYIQELVNRIYKTLSGFDFEIIIVDKSKVTPKLKGARVIKQKSNGLGNAVLEGLKLAKGEIIVTMDGDGSHRPEDLPKLIEKAKDYDIVIGSRYVKGGKSEDKFYKIVISRIYCFFASFILGLKVKDNMSGFAVIKRKIFDKISLNPRGFKINTEILYKAKKFNFKVAEVPITFEQRKIGKPKRTFKEGLRILMFIIELKLGLR
ncbi:MAG: glycosyltransferase, partial [Candidatus Omnitrophica bacterium]|nr:glycosyltransferase [Candidatus Omnitrophota bacterium]